MILYPFSIIFGLVVRCRNFFYNAGIFNSHSYDLPIICVGNLNTGGTGKTPLTEYLIRLLSAKYKVATLSRGYGRHTSGFRVVQIDDDFKDTGDEPLQYKTKFPDISVNVDEKRTRGVEEILKVEPAIDCIVLDDAYQHRAVKAGFNIMVTAFDDLFTSDHILPAGNLREQRSGASRANAILVSKVPDGVSADQLENIRNKINRYSSAHVFFSSIRYGDLINMFSGEVISSEELNSKQVLLVSGIANPQPLKDHLSSYGCSIKHLKYKDHKEFDVSDTRKLREIFNNIGAADKLIVTTEKDAMRLKSDRLSDNIKDLPILFQQIEVDIIERDEFDKLVCQYVEEVKRNS